MRKQIVANDLTALPEVARQLLKDLKGKKVLAVKGKMGAGKTTLIKAFCQLLGVEETVSSPTFALVNEYTAADGESVFHFDFYRIKKIEEVFDIGYEEYFYGGQYCFIEWPEMIEGLLPEEHVMIHITVGEDDKRYFSYNAD